MPSWLSALKLLNPFGIVEGIVEDRKHKRTIKSAIKQKQIERVQAGEIAEVQWNMKAHEGRGWMTNWFAILLSIPLIGAFVPKMVPLIHAGFAALEQMPLWYQAGLGSAMALAFAAKQLQNIPFKAKMDKAYTLPKNSG